MLTMSNSFRALSKDQIHGEPLDPWDLVRKASLGKGRHLHEFFAEDKYGDLIFRELDKYNLLLCHALRELNLDHIPKLVYACAANGAKQIKIYDHRFLLYGGRIYRK